jgi:hypothetical protein
VVLGDPKNRRGGDWCEKEGRERGRGMERRTRDGGVEVGSDGIDGDIDLGVVIGGDIDQEVQTDIDRSQNVTIGKGKEQEALRDENEIIEWGVQIGQSGMRKEMTEGENLNTVLAEVALRSVGLKEADETEIRIMKGTNIDKP